MRQDISLLKRHQTEILLEPIDAESRCIILFNRFERLLKKIDYIAALKSLLQFERPRIGLGSEASDRLTNQPPSCAN